MNALADYGSIFALYILGAVVWSLALIWIIFDADRHYNAGFTWAVFTLVAPLIAIPVYLLMRRGTFRSGADEEQAELRREERMAASSPVARFTETQDGTIKRIPGSWEQPGTQTTSRFRPFNPYREVMERAEAQVTTEQRARSGEFIRSTQADEPPF